MTSVLMYLDSECIIHRDVKIENILYSTSNDNKDIHIYLIDFGCAAYFEDDGLELTEHVGTPVNYAPEIILGH
jgi:serine/threonine protein kinase